MTTRDRNCISDAGGKEETLLRANLDEFRFTFRAPSLANCLTEPTSRSSDDSPISSSSLPQDCSRSLSESVQNFPEEFGRTFHAYRAGSYAFPNDLLERERLDLQARALLKLFEGRLFFSPLSKCEPPRYILDIATGLGDWAIQMGDLFPNAEVIATDLSPIQPEVVPPNVQFYVEDSSDPWDYSHKFDFIHTRATGGCWASFEKDIAQQAFDALEPGGYFESQELDSSVGCDDGTLDEDGPLVRWSRDIAIAGQVLNRPNLMGKSLKETYERVGFIDVQQMLFRVPIHGWPKDPHLAEIGSMWEANLSSGLSGFSVSLFHRAFARNPVETEVFLVDVRRDISDPKVHAWMPCYVVWGRKPHANEAAG